MALIDFSLSVVIIRMKAAKPSEEETYYFLNGFSTNRSIDEKYKRIF